MVGKGPYRTELTKAFTALIFVTDRSQLMGCGSPGRVSFSELEREDLCLCM